MNIKLPIIVKLDEPVSFGKETITELIFNRKMKAKDLKGIPREILFDHMLILLGRLTSQPPTVIDNLGIADTFKAIEELNHFLPDGLMTGGSQSA